MEGSVSIPLTNGFGSRRPKIHTDPTDSDPDPQHSLPVMASGSSLAEPDPVGSASFLLYTDRQKRAQRSGPRPDETIGTSVANPPDPNVFGPPGSGSIY
jgi:hypothetical protein